MFYRSPSKLDSKLLSDSYLSRNAQENIALGHARFFISWTFVHRDRVILRPAIVVGTWTSRAHSELEIYREWEVHSEHWEKKFGMISKLLTTNLANNSHVAPDAFVNSRSAEYALCTIEPSPPTFRALTIFKGSVQAGATP